MVHWCVRRIAEEQSDRNMFVKNENNKILETRFNRQ